MRKSDKPTLGIDVGLSGARAAVVSAEGHLLGVGRVAHAPISRQQGCAERWPEDWYQSAIDAAQQALASAECRELAAIGIGALGPCPILLDAEGNAIAPAPLFSLDGRAEVYRQRLARERGLTQQQLGPDHTLPRQLWWLDHAPALVARAACLVDVTGYLVGRLTGRPVMDPITAGDYHVPGVVAPVDTPAIEPADQIAGSIRDDVADRLGVTRGVPVAVGTYDSFVDVLGTGTSEPGEACIILGSTLIMGAVTETPCATPDMRNSLHVGSGWFFSGWTSCCGSLIDWSKRVLPASDVSSEPGSGGLLALPYFAGERAPHWDPAARGLVLGLTLETTPAQMQRAMIDAVALSARDIAERLCKVPIKRWRVGGGGAHNSILLQALCDALDRPLEIVSHVGEAIAPAILAARAIGRQVETTVERTIVPNTRHSATYDTLYGVYRNLYPALAASMHTLASLQSGSFDALEASLEEV